MYLVQVKSYLLLESCSSTQNFVAFFAEYQIKFTSVYLPHVLWTVGGYSQKVPFWSQFKVPL